LRKLLSKRDNYRGMAKVLDKKPDLLQEKEIIKLNWNAIMYSGKYERLYQNLTRKEKEASRYEKIN
jgi:hypothetical protein